MTSSISYAQRFEDLYVMRCFGERTDGFYIDIGSGHPVYDNMSLAFYLKGWRGVTVEPNPWLAGLTRAVRPRDRHVEAVIGATSGQATFHMVRESTGSRPPSRITPRWRSRSSAAPPMRSRYRCSR